MATEVGRLSKNLLRMKFMQRSLDPETKKQLEEEEKKIISDEHWFLDLPELKEKESFIIEERSFHLCEDFLYGRMSFKGFNPEIEADAAAWTPLLSPRQIMLHVSGLSANITPGYGLFHQKLMVQMNSKTTETKAEEEDPDFGKMDVDVTDEEMALRYESLVDSIRKKFAKKRDHAAIKETEDENSNVKGHKVKKAFLKPQD
ncbi:M-phase phosphoprotein 6 isoform X1 [Ranitomeya variabilis]|uniref:M-phase phosphoprotein 6 isoform X1 n=1 Tax=Ranitomeya variabilis TaxID=490064 RepID=UPI004057BB55